MTTANLIERITGRRRAAEQKTLDSYRDLVTALADDQDIDPARADAILLDAARSPQQLATDVAGLRQRRVDAEIAARLPELRAQRERLNSTLISSRGALRRAENEWREQTTKTNFALNELAGEIQVCEQAERRLRAGRPDARQADLAAEKGQLEQRRNELRFAIGNDGGGLRGRLKSLKEALAAGPQPHAGEWPASMPPSIIAGEPFDAGAMQLAYDAAESHLRGTTKVLADVEARLSVVNAALAEIERRQLSVE